MGRGLAWAVLLTDDGTDEHEDDVSAYVSALMAVVAQRPAELRAETSE